MTPVLNRILYSVLFVFDARGRTTGYRFCLQKTGLLCSRASEEALKTLPFALDSLSFPLQQQLRCLIFLFQIHHSLLLLMLLLRLALSRGR